MAQLRPIKFANTDLWMIREDQVKEVLSLDLCIEDLRAILVDFNNDLAYNYPRVRVKSREPKGAWLHTLRAGWKAKGLAGGKDYTSIDFNTPAMWVTLVNTKTGLPIALIEADYLSRVRTAAVTAIATDLLAPSQPDCLAHFGAGKISQFLVEAVLKVRPSIQRILLVRDQNKPDTMMEAPYWLGDLPKDVRDKLKVVSISEALREADLITTATNSTQPVIPVKAKFKARHVNLVGSNSLKRREIYKQLAIRCLPPDGYLVVEDCEQTEKEAGEFAFLSKARWKMVPTLSKLLVDDAEKVKAREAKFTAFKSVGIGILDLATAEGVWRRLGLR